MFLAEGREHLQELNLAVVRKMVSDALVKGGHEVVGEAGTGTEAVERFVELKLEVMTLDRVVRVAWARAPARAVRWCRP
jgi:AmiR/NasT family two-component response regulator